MAHPQPEPLRSIGPSQAGELLACGYRFAWDRDPSVPRPLKHPKALLGTIGHRVCERAGKGLLGPTDATWDQRFIVTWAQEVTTVSSVHPNLGPPRRWPGYNLQRALWRNRAREVSERAPDRSLVSSEDDPSQGPELHLSGADGRLRGIADVVIKIGDEVEIRDFKSGRVLAETGELSKAYGAQLLLYGALYEETFGIWPKKLVIDPLVREPIEVPADRLQARRLMMDIIEAMESFNSALDRSQLEALAQPSSATCGFCSHLARCSPFWKQVNPSWHGRPRALRGRIVSTRPGVLTIDVEAGSIAAAQWMLGGLTSWEGYSVGQVVLVTDFELRSEGRIACGDSTLVVGAVS